MATDAARGHKGSRTGFRSCMQGPETYTRHSARASFSYRSGARGTLRVILAPLPNLPPRHRPVRSIPGRVPGPLSSLPPAGRAIHHSHAIRLRHAWRSHRFLCPSAQTQARDHALQRLALLMGADATVHMEAADGWVRIIVRLPARYPDDPLPVAGSAANHSSAGAFQPSWYAICPTRSRLEFGTEVAPEEPADASWHQPSREVDASRLVHSLPMIVYPAPTVFSYLFNPFSIPPQESCS